MVPSVLSVMMLPEDIIVTLEMMFGEFVKQPAKNDTSR